MCSIGVLQISECPKAVLPRRQQERFSPGIIDHSIRVAGIFEIGRLVLRRHATPLVLLTLRVRESITRSLMSTSARPAKPFVPQGVPPTRSPPGLPEDCS